MFSIIIKVSHSSPSGLETMQGNNTFFYSYFRSSGDGEHVTPFTEAFEQCLGFVSVLSRCHGTYWTATVRGRIEEQVCS